MIEQAYTIIVSSIPALSRAWRQSPNEMAREMNRVLLMAAVVWVQQYQRAAGNEVDDFTEYTS